MDWWIAFAIFLYFLCAALIIAEVFIPSGGLISIAAFACLIGGIYIFFTHSAVAGWVGIIIAIVMIPTVLVIAYKMFPKTKFGKAMTLTPSDRHIGDAIPDTERLSQLLGQIGKVTSPLRPVGMADFSGLRVECVAESGYIDKGEKIKVIRVESTQLTVRQINED